MTAFERSPMKIRDRVICALLIAVGLVWFAAAEINYDGSMRENAFVQSGMLAMTYVPLATLYLVKSIGGAGRKTDIMAGVLMFLMLWTMAAVDVWVTHFKPNCDYCHQPAGQCFAMDTIGALILTVLVCLSDAVSARLVRRVKHPIGRVWIVRRTLRVGGTLALTALLHALVYLILYVAGRLVWLVWMLARHLAQE